MTLVTRISLTLIVSFTTLLGLMCWIGRAQPVPMTVLFTHPDFTRCQQPCLLGIRPGDTTYARAIALLRLHPLTHGFKPFFGGNIWTDGSSSIILNRDSNNQLSSIELFNRADATLISEAGSLNQMIAALGRPDVVSDDGTVIQSYYDRNRPNLVIVVHRHTLPDAVRFESLRIYLDPHRPF